MENNREIRRVLGKTQKNIFFNQNELEENNEVHQNYSETKDVVAELIDKSEQNNNNEEDVIDGDKFVVWVIGILSVILFATIIYFLFIINVSISAKNNQVTSNSVKQESKASSTSESNLKITDKVERKSDGGTKGELVSTQKTKAQSDLTQDTIKKQSNKQTTAKSVSKSIPKNKYKNANEYLQNVTKVIKELYSPLYSMDNVTMLVDFKNNKYTYLTGEGTRNSGGLYRFIYENQSKFPRYYDRTGNPIPIKITVNGREVTNVSLAISTYDLVMERTEKTTTTPKTDLEKSADYFFE